LSLVSLGQAVDVADQKIECGLCLISVSGCEYDLSLGLRLFLECADQLGQSKASGKGGLCVAATDREDADHHILGKGAFDEISLKTCQF